MRAKFLSITFFPLALAVSLGLYPAHAATNAAQQYPPDQTFVTLRSGTVIPVRVADEIKSNHAKAGDLFTGTVDPSVMIQDHVVIPRGTEAHIRLVDVKKGGHVHGSAKVRLELVGLIMNGERLGVQTDVPGKKESAVHAKSSSEAKHGAAGAGGAVVTGNPADVAAPVIAIFAAAKIDIKPGNRIDFTLEEPFTFRPPPIDARQNY